MYADGALWGLSQALHLSGNLHAPPPPPSPLLALPADPGPLDSLSWCPGHSWGHACETSGPHGRGLVQPSQSLGRRTQRPKLWSSQQGPQ